MGNFQGNVSGLRWCRSASSACGCRIGFAYGLHVDEDAFVADLSCHWRFNLCVSPSE
jgi:hypothetical protein